MPRRLPAPTRAGKAAIKIGRKVIWGKRSLLKKIAKMIVKKSGLGRKLKKLGGSLFSPPTTPMKTIFIPPPNLGAFERYLGKHFKTSLTYAMRVAGKAATKLLRDNTFVKDKGGLERGWKFDVKGMPALFLYNKQPYHIIIERGRRPGKFPNVAALRAWVKRQINPPENEVKSVTYLVGRKIATDGISARPIMTDPGMQKMLASLIFHEIIRILQETCYKQAMIAAMRRAT